MQTDSETESETDNSNDWNTHVRSPTYAPRPPKGPRIPQTNVLLAIEEIKKIDLSVIDHVGSLLYDDTNTSDSQTSQDDRLYDGVFAASNCIIEFLSNVCTLPLLDSLTPRVLALYPHLGLLVYFPLKIHMLI